MDLTELWKPVLLYTCLFGLLTVGAVYLTTHSGLYMLIVAGGGLLLAVLGGGTASAVGSTGTEPADGDGLDSEATGVLPKSTTDASVRLVLLLYGGGVFLWSLGVLIALRDTLV